MREAPGAALPDGLVPPCGRGRLLLVLDNCEHLLDACAALAARLLAACPGLRVLATSREPLQIAGERQHPVPPLAVPDGPAAARPAVAGAWPGYPAVRLFVERAQAVAPGFALTAGERRRRGPGVRPAGRAPPGPGAGGGAGGRCSRSAQIAARLDDCLRLLTGGSRAGPTRQQTLRAALDWSHALLAEPERAALPAPGGLRRGLRPGGGRGRRRRGRRGAAGGGARAGSGAGRASAVLRPPDVLDALTGLVHRSLVVAEPAGPAGPRRPGAARYRLLEPVRQYAAARLAEAGEAAAVRGRHAACCLALAEQAAPALLGPRPARLARPAGRRARQPARRPGLGPGARARGWRCAWPAGCGPSGACASTTPRGGAGWPAPWPAAPEPGRTADWARAALGAGILARDRGDVAAARAHLEASLACARALGEPGLVGLGPARPGPAARPAGRAAGRPRPCWRRGWPWRGPPATGAARRPP